ncbi:MBL fold metallo-hydrolase [Clostridium swellfunianum]|uniref:MBL fold metallo-hydrolase n=1 Tax=Clostridium swellfunianum TaxID=1367462 RepID=UPI002030CAA3|nr:MBL fold metallo-hydrolase [Clostridium swellfunianum]MCM0648012.1 MBL fold metallo-hydrolase [Clostridium swellfunianum]
MKQPQFGKQSTGERLERIKKSPNYKDGKFQNLAKVSEMGGESSFNIYGMLKEIFFNRNGKRMPPDKLPSIKIDLKNLRPEDNIVIWLGHSSFFLQLDGKKMLIDPVLDGYAAPTSIYNRSYKGSDVYSAEDFPTIDYLLISHDHYDHLDYQTVIKLKSKINKIITGLGVGAHFEHWGFDKNILIEKDWYEAASLGEGFKIIFTPSRHRSGRGLKSNQTLWGSFVINTPKTRLFYSGDSGFGAHFKEIGDKYGPFDLALMECGQYSKYWKQSHMMPEEVVQAAIDLKAKKMIPAHWAKFTLSIHDWDEPIKRVLEESRKRNLPLLHPIIGEKVDINQTETTEEWWKKVE